MDLRTKLIFAFVAVSLVSMLALGAFTYSAVRGMLEVTYVRYLSAIAESKADDLENLRSGWLDQVGLIASRTQLRLSLDAWNSRAGVDDDPADHPDIARLARIITDAVGTRAVEGLQVRDGSGAIVAAVGKAATTEPLPAHIANARTTRLLSLDVPPDDHPVLTLATPMTLDGRTIGHLLVVMVAPELADLARDYTGLGATGEILVVRRMGDAAQVLTPLRDGTPAGLLVPLADDTPSAHAATGLETGFEEDALDYAGTKVFAATRSVEGANWGVVVKVNSSEEQELVRSLRDTMTTLGLSVGALAIVVGTLLGYLIGRPIHDLAEVAKRISDGEHHLRAEETGQDEIALLARSFNHMADELVDCATGQTPVASEPDGDGARPT